MNLTGKSSQPENNEENNVINHVKTDTFTGPPLDFIMQKGIVQDIKKKLKRPIGDFRNGLKNDPESGIMNHANFSQKSDSEKTFGNDIVVFFRKQNLY